MPEPMVLCCSWLTGSACITFHFGPFIDGVVFPPVVVMAVEGLVAPAEITPENCHSHVDEPSCTGVCACADGCAVAAEGAFLSLGVLAVRIDSWGGVVSAAVVPVV